MSTEVLLLEEAVDDLEAGRLFYDKRAPGVGEYFVESALADVISLRLYAGVHSVHFGYHRILLKRFPLCRLLRAR